MSWIRLRWALLPALLLLAGLAGCRPTPKEQLAGSWKLLPPEPPELLRKLTQDSLSAMHQHWQHLTEQQLDLQPDGTYQIHTGDPPRPATQGSWRVEVEEGADQKAVRYLVLAKDEESSRRLQILALSQQRVRLQDPNSRERFRLVPVQ